MFLSSVRGTLLPYHACQFSNRFDALLYNMWLMCSFSPLFFSAMSAILLHFSTFHFQSQIPFMFLINMVSNSDLDHMSIQNRTVLSANKSYCQLEFGASFFSCNPSSHSVFEIKFSGIQLLKIWMWIRCSVTELWVFLFYSLFSS